MSPEVLSTWRSRFDTDMAPSGSVVAVFSVIGPNVRYKYLRDDAEGCTPLDAWHSLWGPTLIPAVTWELESPELFEWTARLAEPFSTFFGRGETQELAYTSLVVYLTEFEHWLRKPENASFTDYSDSE